MPAKNSKRTTKAKPIYKDPSAAIDLRVEDLLARMTTEEKVHQMCGAAVVAWIKEPAHVVLLKDGKFQMKNAEGLMNRCIGGFSEILRYIPPREGAELVNKLQRYALTKTRLGIPVLIIDEALHGSCAENSTAFPQAIGWASTWDVDLVHRMGQVIGREVRGRGITQVFSPILDLSLDPRWGRTEETLGEDPHLVSRLGVAYVTGVQGHPSSQFSVITTIKHYGVHNAPESGCNIGPTVAGERMVRDLLLKPFEAAVREGRSQSVMAAYSEWDGVPASANRWLLTDMLRKEWGFDGFVVSDYGSVTMLHDRHGIAATKQDAAMLAVDAGLDMEVPVINAFGELIGAAERGEFPIAKIDQSVRRILTAKFRLGLFENPYVDVKFAVAAPELPEHRATALEAARKSIVLLKNDRRVLPLKGVRSIAVIGPNADAPRIGNYGTSKRRVVTALEGIRKLAPRGVKVEYAKGCEIYGDNKQGFAEALALAERSDVAVLVMGEVSDWGAENPNPVSGEGYDSNSLQLGGWQMELIQQVCAIQKNVVVVLYNGRPLALRWVKDNIAAVIEAWYPGEEGGTALAEILFGKTNPSGRLPITIPASVGQLPVYYYHKPTARGFSRQGGTFDKAGKDYVFDSTDVLYPFGWGLSYTRFEYGGLSVTPGRVAAAGEVTVSFTVRNAGEMAGEEVAQVYVRDVLASVTRPVKELRGFRRVFLRPGESKAVSVTIRMSDLAFHNPEMKLVVEPGTIEVMVGGNSVDLAKTSFEIVGPGDKADSPTAKAPKAASKSAKKQTTAEMGWH